MSQQDAETQALLRATRAVVDEPELAKVVRTLFDACRELIGGTVGYVDAVDPEAGTSRLLVLESASVPPPISPARAMPLRGLRALAFASAHALISNDFQSEPQAAPLPPNHLPLENVLFAPSRVDGKTVGLLVLGNKPGGFSEHDGQLAEAFAELVAIALRDHQRSEVVERSEAWFRGVFEGVSDGILIADLTTSAMVMGNPAMARLLGIEAARLADVTLDDLFEPHQQSQVREEFERLPSGPWSLSQVRVKRADGSVFHADISVSRLELEQRDLAMGCFRDVSERRNLEASLAQSDRLATLGMLAAGIAHEINNPLTYLALNLETLVEDLPALLAAAGHPAGEEVEGLLQRLRDAQGGAARIQEISRGLGTFSRIEQAAPSAVSVQEALEHAATMAKNEMKYRAGYVTDFAQGLPHVLATEAKLAQVFLNLLLNAAHAIPEGRAAAHKIQVRTRGDRGGVLVEVSDTGRGIPQAQQPHVFEPFLTTTKPAGEGSGLGLSICRNLVIGFGGEIGFTSEPGAGTTFRVWLPGAKPVEEPVPEDVPPARTPARARILVVDDEAELRKVLARLLRGHEVVCAGSGTEAQEIVRGDPAFDLVICDVMMPAMSGVDLHRWLAATRPELARRVVFMSGGTFTGAARRYLATVGNPCIDKPFEPVQVRKLVQRLADEALDARREAKG